MKILRSLLLVVLFMSIMLPTSGVILAQGDEVKIVESSNLTNLIGLSLIIALFVALLINAYQAYQANKTSANVGAMLNNAFERMTTTVLEFRKDTSNVDKIEASIGKYVPVELADKLLEAAKAISPLNGLDALLTQLQQLAKAVGDGKPNVPPSDTPPTA